MPEKTAKGLSDAAAQDEQPSGLPGLVAGLKQTLIKPEMYFAEPPMCNVVFPDEMYSINVSRNFLSEPTRGVDYTDHIFDQFGSATSAITSEFTISPAVSVGSDGRDRNYCPPEMVDLVNRYRQRLYAFGQTLLPEEVLKGVMPLQTTTSSLLRSAALGPLRDPSAETGETLEGTAAQQNQQNQANTAAQVEGNREARLKNVNVAISSRQTIDEQNDTKVRFNLGDTLRKRFYVQEANYKFLVARYQARTAAVSCKFLPRLLPGYTALVSEKQPLKNLEKVGDFFGFVGHIIQLTHFVSQSGGVTSINMSHVRPTSEKLDFFDVDHSGVTHEIVPDYRTAGVLPWALNPKTGKNNFGPEFIEDRYVEWFGGSDWRGVDISTVAAAVREKYLGILPISRAVISEPKTNIGLEGAVLWDDFLPYVRALFRGYQQEVATNRSRTGHLENFIQYLTRRPVANRLQVRGYLNAHLTLPQKKHITEKSKSSASAINRGRQRFLVKYGFYEDGGSSNDADGALGKRTKKAIENFQKFAGIAVTGVWGIDTQQAALKHLNDTTGDNGATTAGNAGPVPPITAEERQNLEVDLGSLVDNPETGQREIIHYGSDILNNRKRRRNVRVAKVDNYRKSLLPGPRGGRGLKG